MGQPAETNEPEQAAQESNNPKVLITKAKDKNGCQETQASETKLGLNFDVGSVFKFHLDQPHGESQIKKYFQSNVPGQRKPVKRPYPQ